MDVMNIEVWVQFPCLVSSTMIPLAVLEVELVVEVVVPLVQVVLGWLDLVGGGLE